MATDLPAHLADTLAHVAPKQWRTTEQIFKLVSSGTIKQTAISNRLSDLEILNMVVSKRVWKTKFWRRAK